MSIEIETAGTAYRRKSSAIASIGGGNGHLKDESLWYRPGSVPNEDATRLHTYDRRRYVGSLMRNFLANVLPSLYTVLTLLWVAELNPKYVAVASIYYYVSAASEAINEGFPKAAWSLVADNAAHDISQRFLLATTLTIFVGFLGSLLTISIISAAPRFAVSFAPEEVRSASIFYIRLSSGSLLCSIIISVLSICARSLDEPDIPLLIQLVKFLMNIVLDVLFISRFRVVETYPTVNTQALIRLSCDILATLVGISWFLRLTRRRIGKSLGNETWTSAKVKNCFYMLVLTGWPMQVEVIPRMTLNLWFSAEIIGLGSKFAAAWGVFFTIRIAILFAPLLAIEASCYTFVGHAWGRIAARNEGEKKLGFQDLLSLWKTILTSVALVASLEIIIYVVFSFGPGRQLALFLSNSAEVAELEVEIWRKIDWGYIFLAVFFQTTSAILIAKPRWYLYQSLLVNVGFYLPLLVAGRHNLNATKTPWSFIILASAAPSLLTLFNNLGWTGFWVFRLLRGSHTRTG